MAEASPYSGEKWSLVSLLHLPAESLAQCGGVCYKLERNGANLVLRTVARRKKNIRKGYSQFGNLLMEIWMWGMSNEYLRS